MFDLRVTNCQKNVTHYEIQNHVWLNTQHTRPGEARLTSPFFSGQRKISGNEPNPREEGRTMWEDLWHVAFESQLTSCSAIYLNYGFTTRKKNLWLWTKWPETTISDVTLAWLSDRTKEVGAGSVGVCLCVQTNRLVCRLFIIPVTRCGSKVPATA